MSTETEVIRTAATRIDEIDELQNSQIAAQTDQIAALQDENAALRARIKELEDAQNPTPPVAQAWISPSGTGDGSSEGQPAALSALDALVEKVGPGGLVTMLEGVYPVGSVTLRHGGAEGKPVTIRCKGTVQGNRNKGADSIPYQLATSIAGARNVKQQPMWGNTGNNFLTFAAGVSHVVLEDFKINDCARAIIISDRCEYLTFKGFRNFNCQDHFYEAFAARKNPDGTPMRDADGKLILQESPHLQFIDNVLLGFSKSGIRLDGNTNDVLVQDCIIDSGFQSNDEFADAIKIGSSSSTGGDPSSVHNVRVINSVLRNCVDIESSGDYWNGDGSSAERTDYDLLFQDVEASGNSDGGIDSKASPTILVRPDLHDNKNNVRCWGTMHIIDGKAYDNHKIAGAPYGDAGGGTGSSYNVMVIGGASASSPGGRLFVWGTFEGSWSLKAHENAGGKVYNAGVVDNRPNYPDWYDQETRTIKRFPAVA